MMNMQARKHYEAMLEEAISSMTTDSELSKLHVQVIMESIKKENDR